MWTHWVWPSLVLYGVAAGLSVHGRVAGRAQSATQARRLCALGFLIQSIYLPLVVLKTPAAALAEHRVSVVLLTWVAAGLFLWLTRSERWLAIGPLYIPMLFLLSLFTVIGDRNLPPMLSGAATSDDGLSILMSLHTVAALLAVAIYCVAGLLTALYWWGERALKSRRPTQWWLRLPALPQMEAAMGQLFIIGFLPLTITISTGLAFAHGEWWRQAGHQGWLSIAGWLAYALVLPGRRLAGQRWMTLSLLGLGLLGLTILEVHL